MHDIEEEDKELLDVLGPKTRNGAARCCSSLGVAVGLAVGLLLGYGQAALVFANINGNYTARGRDLAASAALAARSPAAGQGDGSSLAVCRQLWARKEGNYALAERNWFSMLAQVGRAIGGALPHKPHRLSFDAYEPLWSCEERERVGAGTRYATTGDGPKFVCGVETLKQPCLVYNIGSNNDVSFESAIHAHTGCEIHTFDHTLSRPYIGSQYSSFHAIGLAGRERVSEKGWNMMSLADIMRNLSHVGRRIDILKVDCEGCEWEALPAVFSEMEKGKLSVGQLLIEVHVMPVWTRRHSAFFDNAAKAGLRMFSKERNHWGCDGWMCVEFSYVDRQHACRAFTNTHCPAASPEQVCPEPPRVGA
ncbi:methyltransferase domain-containing protein [Pavlovales sp. CCMP2436]|nr:methyltransferase domain-containing protein [Pavlovales sp. CCMP2436]|mmetsp:Transcript_33801/g.84231  ORF Transcript_33801/g.84231 Transcript_33801/m.84231 type:complete len:364 (-) Transcript_33801:186-1277(-)